MNIEDLIQAHRIAVVDFRQALRLGNAADEDRAFMEEGRAMMALLSHPPQTLEEAQRRAVYLVTTRFAVDESDEARALLWSFVCER